MKVDFGNENGTYSHANDLMKVVDTVRSQQRILEQVANGVISKKTACDVLGIPEKVIDGLSVGLGVPPEFILSDAATKNKEDCMFPVNANGDAFALKKMTLGRAYRMSQTLAEKVVKETFNGADPKKREQGTPMGVSKTTVSATIVLASGREVHMPDPDSENWELIETRPLGPASRVRARLRAPSEPETYLVIAHCFNGQEEKPAVLHETGRCWLKDMTRIVNMTEKVDHFTTKYAYVTELRFFQERVVEAELDSDRPYPTLRAYLW